MRLPAPLRRALEIDDANIAIDPSAELLSSALPICDQTHGARPQDFGSASPNALSLKESRTFLIYSLIRERTPIQRGEPVVIRGPRVVRFPAL